MTPERRRAGRRIRQRQKAARRQARAFIELGEAASRAERSIKRFGVAVEIFAHQVRAGRQP